MVIHYHRHYSNDALRKIITTNYSNDALQKSITALTAVMLRSVITEDMTGTAIILEI